MEKILICLAAMVMAVSVGCSEKAADKPETDTSAQLAVEEGKFDFYSAVADMKICGHDVSLPCTFRELGEGFAYDTLIEDSKYMFSTLRHNGEDVGVIYLEPRSDGKYEESQIVSLILNSKSEASVKGVTNESTEEDIKKALGEDFTKTDLNIDYGSEGNGFIRILLNSVTNTPSGFTIMMPTAE